MNAPVNPTQLPVVVRAGADIFDSPEAFEHAQRVAKVFAISTLVPEAMRNVPNALLALHMAKRLNEHPLTVMQNIFWINGRPGWLTQYMISRVNASGIFKGRITWKTEGAGKDMVVTASAVLADTGEIVTAHATMQMAIAEDWVRNKKYATMPEHMLRWRSAAMLIRLYAPEVMLGLPTVEEVETLPAVQDVTPQKSNLGDALNDFAKGLAEKQAEAVEDAKIANGETKTEELKTEEKPKPAEIKTDANGEPELPEGLKRTEPPVENEWTRYLGLCKGDIGKIGSLGELAQYQLDTNAHFEETKAPEDVKRQFATIVLERQKVIGKKK